MKIVIVVPSLTGETKLKDILVKQSLKDFNLKIIKGVRPNGKARNVGWKGTKADFVVFIDDDAVLGSRNLLKNLISPLEKNKADIVGASRRLPSDANRFAKWASNQIPLIETPVVEKLTISNPALQRSGLADKSNWSLVSTTCCAMKREVLTKTGGFNEDIQWGVDTEFFYRARKMGFNISLAPKSWVYHPYASNLKELWKKYFKSGIGTAQETRLNPDRNLQVALNSPLNFVVFIFVRLSAIMVYVLVLKPLRAFSILATSVGFVYGWYFK